MAKEGEGQGGKPQDDQDADPGDGSQRKAWEPPNDGSWIPKVRFDEAVNDLKGQIATLQARVEAKTAAPPEKPEKVFTRAELKSLVAEGKISEEASDAYWEKQIIETATRKATEGARTAVTEQERATTTAKVLKEYRTLVPAAWDPGSKEREKVANEFRALRELGFPDDPTTEAAALRAAFGDPEAIKASRSTGRKGPGETHVEVGGGERNTDAGKDADDGPPKGMDQRKAAYYQKAIDRGIYPDWKAVKAEISYKPAAKRA